MFYDVYKSFSYSISVGDLHLRVTTSSLDTVDSAQVSGLSPLRKTVTVSSEMEAAQNWCTYVNAAYRTFCLQ